MKLKNDKVDYYHSNLSKLNYEFQPNYFFELLGMKHYYNLQLNLKHHVDNTWVNKATFLTTLAKKYGDVYYYIDNSTFIMFMSFDTSFTWYFPLIIIEKDSNFINNLDTTFCFKNFYCWTNFDKSLLHANFDASFFSALKQLPSILSSKQTLIDNLKLMNLNDISDISHYFYYAFIFENAKYHKYDFINLTTASLFHTNLQDAIKNYEPNDITSCLKQDYDFIYDKANLTLSYLVQTKDVLNLLVYNEFKKSPIFYYELFQKHFPSFIDSLTTKNQEEIQEATKQKLALSTSEDDVHTLNYQQAYYSANYQIASNNQVFTKKLMQFTKQYLLQQYPNIVSLSYLTFKNQTTFKIMVDYENILIPNLNELNVGFSDVDNLIQPKHWYYHFLVALNQDIFKIKHNIIAKLTYFLTSWMDYNQLINA